MSEAQTADIVVAALRQGEGPTALYGIELVACGPERAIAAMVLDARSLNGLGSAHGGILFTLADTAFAWACNGRNVATVAQAATMTFLSPGRSGERIVAEARASAACGRTGVWDVRITGEDGRVVALFQGLSRSLARPVVDLATGEMANG